MGESNMDRRLGPISPVDSMLSNEVFRVKPVSKDSDRKQDDRFDEQMKKKKREEEKPDTVRTGSADITELDEEAPFVRDEIILSGLTAKSTEQPDNADASKKAGINKPLAGKDGHVDVVA